MKKVSTSKTIIIYLLATSYFYFLLYTLYPFLKKNLSANPAVYWFMTGYFLFTPIIFYPLMKARQEGNNNTEKILKSLHIKLFSKRDWAYAIYGTLLLFLLSGLIYGTNFILNKYFGIPSLDTNPWFIHIMPFRGNEIFLLLIWLPMFCLNIIGEEILWRGYIQARLNIKKGWLLCSVLWLAFHLPFGMDIMLMLLPIVFIIPYCFSKTKNTLIGIFIHAIYNGPIFILISLGILK